VGWVDVDASAPSRQISLMPDAGRGDPYVVFSAHTETRVYMG
jgi:hypothetical protein